MTNSPSMPGAFLPPRDQGAAPRLSGAKSHIFQPPRTPSASASSSMILTRSTASMMSFSSSGVTERKTFTRKRTLDDYHEAVTPKNNVDTDEWSGAKDTVEDGWTPGSPQPFVNTRYQLAGGMDTPSLVQQHAIEQSQYADAGYRRSLGDVGKDGRKNVRSESWRGQDSASYFPLQDDMGREVNGRGRYEIGDPDSSPKGDGWSKTAFQVVGDVVGKVWEFCKSGGAVFRGFQAGGGTGYQVNSTDPSTPFAPVADNDTSFWQEKGAIQYGYDRESTPLPGQFPEDDFIPDYLDNPTPEHTPPQPAKRRQISRNNTDNEIAKNWVVVSETQTPTPSKPQIRAPARYSMPTSSSASRRAIANTSSHRPASRVGLNTRRPVPANTSSRVSHAGSPALNTSSRASFASPRSPASLSGSKIPRAPNSNSGNAVRSSIGPGNAKPESPVAKEARRWAAVKRKEEREQDESIRRLDAQLKAMIREGKEALGTKIEVEIDDDFELDYGNGGSKKWSF